MYPGGSGWIIGVGLCYLGNSPTASGSSEHKGALGPAISVGFHFLALAVLFSTFTLCFLHSSSVFVLLT